MKPMVRLIAWDILQIRPLAAPGPSEALVCIFPLLLPFWSLFLRERSMFDHFRIRVTISVMFEVWR